MARRRGGGSSQVFAVPQAIAGASPSAGLPGYLLEDFSQASVRQNHDTPPDDLWQLEDADFTLPAQVQTGGFDAANHQFTATCTSLGAGGSSVGVYFQFLSFPWVFPNGFVQSYLLSGSPDFTLVNRLYFRVRRSADLTFNVGSDNLQVGNYCKSHLETGGSDQGQHYYWQSSVGYYANEWAWVFLDRQSQHLVGAPSNDVNFPYDPENQSMLLGQIVVPGGRTATVTNGSPTVTFTSGDINTWISLDNVIHFSQDGALIAYQVKSVDSTTQLTLGDASPGGLTQNYAGPSNSGQTVTVVVPLPAPAQSLPHAPTTYPDATQHPVHFFDGLTRFYFDGEPFARASQRDLNVTYAVDDYYFDLTDESSEPIFAIAGSADIGPIGGPATVTMKVVSTVTVTYNPAANAGAGGYELTWACPKNLAVGYKVAYKATSLKAAGGGTAGWSSGTWDGTTVNGPNSSGGGCKWVSPVLPRGTYYFGILPVDNGATLPNPNGYFTEVWYRVVS